MIKLLLSCSKMFIISANFSIPLYVRFFSLFPPKTYRMEEMKDMGCPLAHPGVNVIGIFVTVAFMFPWWLVKHVFLFQTPTCSTWHLLHSMSQINVLAWWIHTLVVYTVIWLFLSSMMFCAALALHFFISRGFGCECLDLKIGNGYLFLNLYVKL